MNQITGYQTLVTSEGMWTPQPYEHLVETRPLNRVMANEAVVVRDHNGTLTIYDGTLGAAGTAFFLQPLSQIVTIGWSVYDEPDANGSASVTLTQVGRIDMRIQRTPYGYSVRTKDNVNLMLVGTI